MSGPYTIRERRANILASSPTEAYPGQRESLLARLIESDLERAAQERELAAEARHGGRAITRKLAKRERVLLRAAAGEITWANAWRYQMDPTSGWASYARELADGRDDWGSYPVRRLNLVDAEAMLDWPIYRAAFAATRDL